MATETEKKDYKILIVEDEYLIAMSTQQDLEGMGFSVTGIAMSGEEAIKMVERMKPDIILMDIVLQGRIDGIEAAAEIQKRATIPVIFLSGNLEGENLKRIEKIANFGCVSKPYEDATLRHMIRYALTHVNERIRHS
jgi:CheY-like chemotaxis protein